MASPTPPQIGIFDSGIGGLSVLRALRRHLPQARCSYIADARHTPWGDRPAAWVQARSLQLSGQLLAQGADLVLVACNTATTQAIAALRQRWPQQRFVGVEPGLKPAIAASRSGRVAVMGTTATLASPRFAQLLAAHGAGCDVLRLPCPGLVEAIEQDDPAALDARLDQIAAALRAADVDTVVLGCTHYPLVAEALAQRLGPSVTLIDTADAVARQVARQLGLPSAADTDPAPQPPDRSALPRLYSTGAPAELQRAARRWIAAGAFAELLLLPDPDAGSAALTAGTRDGTRTRTPEGGGF